MTTTIELSTLDGLSCEELARLEPHLVKLAAFVGRQKDLRRAETYEASTTEAARLAAEARLEVPGVITW